MPKRWRAWRRWIRWRSIRPAPSPRESRNWSRLFPITKREALRLAASLEQASEHPLASAIVRAAKERGIELAKAEHFRSATGLGVTGFVDGQHGLGGKHGLHRSGCLAANRPRRCAAQGQTVVCAAIDGKAAALFGIADPVKTTAGEAIRALRDAGLRIIMLTGDNRVTAETRRATSWASIEIEAQLPARRKNGGDRAFAGARPHGCDGRRWHQRRARAGQSQRRYCDGHRARI